MRLNVKALTLTAGILWGAAVFLTGIANLLWPGYGSVFLEVMASLYPGYDDVALLSSVIIGTLYAPSRRRYRWSRCDGDAAIFSLNILERCQRDRNAVCFVDSVADACYAAAA